MSSGAGTPERPRELPDVVVVIPTRGGRAESLRRAVDAVAGNGYPGQVTVLVVADGVDTTAVGLVPSARVQICANERAPGLAGARNTGLLRASAPFIAFCDDDDEWLPGKLELQVRLLAAHPESMAASCGIAIMHDGRCTSRRSPRTVRYGDLLESRIMTLHSSTLLLRREVLLREVGLLDEQLPGGFGEDYDLLLRIALVSDIVTIPDAQVRVYWHGGSYYFSRWAMIAESLTYLLEKHPDFSGSRRGRARVEAQIAVALAASGRRRAGLRAAGRAFARWPAERRVVPAVLIGSGLVSAETLQRLAHRRGRGL